MQDLSRALSEHPCFCEDAHRSFARMHIPVAPRCNIQCNYCNRKFDCCNESRPGVTSEVLTAEQAAAKIRMVKEKIPQLSVIGIAGPGDPLANEETFRSLEIIRKEFPEMTLCVSSNGLALPESAQRLFDLGVRFVTVTMNCTDPDIGMLIYDTVVFNGRQYKGREGAEILRDRQLQGITACVSLGMLVKINIVMIPGINDCHIPELVREMKGLGVHMVNIIPLIPVEGTKFSDRRAPTPLERKELMDLCGIDVKVMRHCRQCRADAIGMLDDDRSSEFNGSGCRFGCGSDEQPINVSIGTRYDESVVAVATSDGRTVDCGFGNAKSFRIYATDGDTCRYIETREVPPPVAGTGHRDHIESVLRILEGCGTVIVSEIGPLPSKSLSDMGIRVVVTEGDINNAVRSSDA